MTSDARPAPDLRAAADDAWPWPNRSSTPASPPWWPPAVPTSAQVLAYDLAHAAAAVRTAEAVLAYGAHGDTEARIACAFVADALADLAARIIGRSDRLGRGRPTGWHRPRPFVAAYRDPDFLASLADRPGRAPPRRRLRAGAGHLPPVRRGADPARGPSTSTGPTPTSPRRSSPGWPRWAASACRSPRSTAASPPGARPTTWAWWWPPRSCRGARWAPAARSSPDPRSSPGPSSTGGTEEQKQHWLPKLATAEVMGAVAVTEPDFGSDVAGVVTAATDRRGLADQRGEDLVHVRRPGRRAHAAGPHRPRPAEGPPGPVAVPGGEAPGRRPRLRLHPGARARTAVRSDSAGRMEGRAIDTLGYRGMHSYEVAFENWFVPDANLVGGEERPGPGLLPPDAGLRERPPADRGAGRRGHAGRLRGGPRVRREPGGVRRADRRLPADPGQAGPDGRAHPGGPPVLLRGGPPDGQGRGDASRPR